MTFNYQLDFVRSRYDRLARIYPFFELIFLLPPGIRSRAVKRLELKNGDKVLEIGCGTGRNLRHLVEAVGPEGKVYAIDYCEAMLDRAKKLRDHAGWHNVELSQQDAATLRLPEMIHGVLFSLSYSVMPEPYTALTQAWRYLCPGRSVVIMDGKLANGALGRLSGPFVTWLSRRTILGDPDRQPWKDLRALTTAIEVEEINFGTYYICKGRKAEG